MAASGRCSEVYALIDRDPPFTTSQLEALVMPEVFEVIDWPAIFGVTATPIDRGARARPSGIPSIPDRAGVLMMARVVVIGAGAMGLAAAYHALKLGHQVTVFEADRDAGGMAAHFDFDGLSIERFYHFVCKADQATFDLMAELGIARQDALGATRRWATTSTARHYPLGRPGVAARLPQALADREAALRR